MQSNPDISTGLYHGLEAWQVRTANATAVVSVFGGQLLSFIPMGSPICCGFRPRAPSCPRPSAVASRCAGRGSAARARAPMHRRMAWYVPHAGSFCRPPGAMTAR